jgi:hypothetical protein
MEGGALVFYKLYLQEFGQVFTVNFTGKFSHASIRERRKESFLNMNLKIIF